VFKEYPSLSINTLLANPKAYLANRRFIDTDMNREFSSMKLNSSMRLNSSMKLNSSIKLQKTSDMCSEEDEETRTDSSLPYEALRAQEIEAMFGAPKTGGDVANVDMVIDLHTTTSNMGITLIFTEGDALMSAAAAYALHKCKTDYGYENVHILLLPKTDKHDRTHLPSVGKHDITIEVGPTPQGVIRVSTTEYLHCFLSCTATFLYTYFCPFSFVA
jgi:succinylglutamate desuccinylase